MVQQIEFYKREADRNKNNHDIILQGLQRNAKELNEQLMRKEKELNAKL